MASSGMLRRVGLVRTDVTEELSASLIKVTRIGELGTTLAVISNRRTLRRNISSQRAFTLHIEVNRTRGPVPLASIIVASLMFTNWKPTIYL
jgi:hypothetical protein